ncbi:TonB-dependent receptor [Zhongshania borealis]|uniref:TonB-dependent receptor n=1 Tax=Zhongshania borealis TaxID=889488 RepID=A0ABP7X3X5_9GAMM
MNVLIKKINTKEFIGVVGSIAALFGNPSYADVEEDNLSREKEVRAKVVEEVEVVGMRLSAQSQRDAKKNSTNVSDSIFAESMGKLPDENIAEAMQRITGVGISREDGEGSMVTIRGIDPSLNNVSMNGVTMTNGGDDNAVDFSSMSADMLKSIEVVKSPSANHDEGSLGGTINLKTFRPLEIKRAKRNVSVQIKTNSLAQKDDIAVKASMADKFNNDYLGVVMSGFYDEQSVRQDYFNTLNWRIIPLANATSAQTGEEVLSAYDPAQLQAGVKFNERIRYGGTATFQIEPDTNSSLSLDLSYSMLEVKAKFHQIRMTSQRDGNVVDDHSGTSFSASAETTGNVLSSQQQIETETLLGGLTYEREIGDWNLSSNLSYSQAVQKTPENRRVNFKPERALVSTNWLDENGNIQDMPTMSGSVDNGIYDPAVTRLFQLYDDNRDAKDTYKALSVNIEGFIEYGPIVGVELGAKYFSRLKSTSKTTGNTPFSVDADGNPVYLSDYALDFPVNDFFGGIQSNVISGWVIPDFEALFNTYLPGGYDGPTDLINTYDIETDALAGYVMANLSTFEDRLMGDIGVRFVETNTSSVGHEGINFPANQGGISTVTPVNIKKKYSNVLPSMNLRFVLSEEMLLRFSVAKVMSRPPQSKLRPGTVIRATNPTNVWGSGGNPRLDPTEATQYDLSWEWYFDESGLVSVAGFYKDVATIIYNATQDQVVECPEGVDDENCALLDDPVPVNQAINGGGGKVLGLELAYQQDLHFLPGFLQGFGYIINYTYTESEGSYVDPEQENSEYYDDFPFLSTSKDTFNTTVYWENDRYSARLAYNYRSDYLVNPVALNSSVWQDARSSLDLSMSAVLTKGLKLSLAATNLTNESNRKYITLTVPEEGFETEGNALKGGVPTWRTAYYGNTGRTLRLGLNYSF